MPNRPTPTTVTLAHSADADDVFMWWPITGKVDPADPDRVLSPPAIDTGGLRFRSIPADISQLNKRAIATGDLDITAISFAAYAQCADRYVLSSVGSSFGVDFGPKLVCRAERGDVRLESLRAKAGADRKPRISVPGLQTSAFLTLSMLLGAGTFEAVEVPFDRVAELVIDGRVDAGLLIHEAQFTYESQGLRLLEDLGKAWMRKTGLPMPLGANAVNRGLDTRLGPGGVQRVVTLMHRSLQYALAHRSESLDYARGFSPLKDDATLDAYVGRYVNAFTTDARGEGMSAVRLLIEEGVKLGLFGSPGQVEMVGPAGNETVHNPIAS